MAGDGEDIPAFLLVKNRVPLTDAQRARLDEIQRAIKEKTMPNIVGAREKSLRDMRETAPKKSKSIARAALEAAPKPAGKPPKKRKVGKPAAKKPASKPARASTAVEIRSGSKLEAVIGLLKRPEGCTTAEVLKLTGWPAVSMPQQARAAGLKLRKEKEGTVTRYWAA